MAGLRRAKRAAMVGAIVALGLVAPAFAQEQGQLFATQEDGYARLILSFPGRDDLPDYEMRIENGVLSLEFDEKVAIILPDVGTTMAPYLSVARVDPDGMGLRIGLRAAFSFNRIEAGGMPCQVLGSRSMKSFSPASMRLKVKAARRPMRRPMPSGSTRATDR